MLPERHIIAAAEALRRATDTRRPIEPLTEQHPEITVGDAYEIQRLQVQRWIAEGRAITGYKVGLTSRAMQQQLGVDEPDYGILVAGMNDESGVELHLADYIAPRLEPEIAFTLRHDLRGPGLSVADVTAAVGEVVGVLEIIDSRIEGWRIRLADTIADNASSAGVVVGITRLPLTEVDLEGLEVALQVDGTTVASGRGADVMGSPLNALAWVANRLGEFGVPLHAGTIVLPGSVCAAVPLTPGTRVHADFGVLGQVEVEVARDAAADSTAAGTPTPGSSSPPSRVRSSQRPASQQPSPHAARKEQAV